MSIVGFALAGALLVFVSVTAYRRLGELRHANRSVEHTLTVQSNLATVLSLLSDAETGQRGFLLTGSASYLEPYDAAVARLPQRLTQLRQLTNDNPGQQDRLVALEMLAQRKLAELDATIAARKGGGPEAAARIIRAGEGKHVMDEIRGVVDAMRAEEGRLLTERTALEAQHGTAATWATVGGLVFALVLVVIATVLLSHAGRERDRDYAARMTAERVARAISTSEERLRVTLASIGDAVIATDDQGRVTLMNVVAQALTGWHESDAMGRDLAEVFVIVNEESRRRVESPVERALREGGIVGLANHTILLSKDGREVAIDDSAAPIRSADGRLAGVVMVFRDITERRLSERRQALEHAVTRALAESTPVEEAVPEVLHLIGEGLGWDTAALWTVDQDANLLRCADVWHRPATKVEAFKAGTRQRTFEPGVGLPGRVWATREPVWLSNVAEETAFLRAAEAAADGVHGAVFVPILTGSDVVGVIEMLSQRVQPRDPDVLLTMSSVADRIGHFLQARRADEIRTELLAGEREVRREAEAANRTKDEFLAMLSHELRTPLTSILGWARALRKTQAPPAQVEQALASIERNAQLQARLIEDLLDVSRIVSGKLTLETQLVDVATIVDAALETVRGSAETSGIQVILDIDRAVPSVAGDPARLQQVVCNLLSNAIKFTDRGGRVDVRVHQVDRSIELIVEDTGCGIRPELLPHVFDRFQQGESSSSRARGGLGLGLTIVRHLVEGHGGTVQAESAGKGRGTMFTVRLPLTQIAREETSSVSNHRQARPSVAVTLDGVRILVVDDDLDTRDMVAAILSAAHAEVRSARSVKEARDILEKYPVDVMISDIYMEGEDGHALIRHVRATEVPPRHLFTIALTAHARDDDRISALAAGFDAYVPKPLDPADLVGRIARAAERGSAG